MPTGPLRSTFEEEEDAVPLSDLLRTGEASRLRRRGAMRNGHRREESDEFATPLNRRARMEPATQRGMEQTRDGHVYLELSCGARTVQFSTEPSGSSRSSPLPQTRPASPSADLGFLYASTGCDTVINSTASPSQQGCSYAHQVYISTDTSNPDVTSLPSEYLDREQRSIAEFLSRADSACKCDWEAIGCRVCGNTLGFLHIPCHSGHSMDMSRVYGGGPTYVFFPSSVTPSPSHAFPRIDPAIYRSMPGLAPPSESDDMSIDSPTFSPRVQTIPDDGTVFRLRSPVHRAQSQPYLDDFFDFSQMNDANPSLAVNDLGSPTTPTHFSFSAAVEERSADHPQADSEFEPSTSNHHLPPSDSQRLALADVSSSSTYGHSSRGPRLSTRYSYAAPRPRTNLEALSDDEWNAFLERDRPPSSTRRHLEGQSDRAPLRPWVPRELRERPAGALVPGERTVDRLATITYPEYSERGIPHFTIGAASPARPPEPPTLHRVPRRSLSTMTSPSRRPASFDNSPWRPRSTAAAGMIQSGSSRSVFVPERQEPARDGERGLRMSRWATMPSASAHPRRRPTMPVTSASTPVFTLVDSAGERSYPPSARSSLDARDTLSVDSDADASGIPSRQFYDYLLPMEPEYRDSSQLWGNAVRTEEPEVDDEEKAEDELQAEEALNRRSPFVVRSRELVLDEQSVNSVTQLPLG